MARTTKAQQLAEAGVAAVLKECTNHGWFGEYVVKDFGEDLVFQTNFKGTMDPFRIFGQVKSFSSKPALIRISSTHLLKWTLMAELLVIFIYVKDENSLSYFSINERLSFYEIWISNKRTISININDCLPLNSTDLSIIEWISRRRGLNFLFSQYRTNQEANPNRAEAKYLSDEQIGLGVLFLNYLSLIESEEPKEMIWSLLRAATQDNLNPLDELSLFIVEEWVRVSGGLGLTPVMAVTATGAMCALLSRRGVDILAP